ncbi:hypothetical protein J14TS2_53990 [Bacillus sp. J14TS2]|uniref:DNA/RNA helicase domain-containing protein n=1 Tax=Bacillus sp. J14TS2 TaxID=2807188 RepID=UPI001B1FD1B3|nr:DNA/RNA helicase domain-containing protein [Bacillus sp. J14TS2]GIN74924.1 hypothetical protein J14TS2_53990 [Bacillus sp. J14TS2]
MEATKLIMVEGIPGSGKSTTAQSISKSLDRMGYKHKWWYEEEQGHPVYVYDDNKAMQKIIDDLSSGNYQKVIALALKSWNEFVVEVQSSSDIIIVDSCLFGYLTWSLFPFEVPKQEIVQYVKDVERIIKPLNPHIIYFYQSDIGAALEKICTRRGEDTENNFVRAATQSPYGKSKGLIGFKGMVTYWQDYRSIIDQAFQDLECPKIAINNTDGNWSDYTDEIAAFLGISEEDGSAVNEQNFHHVVGTYSAELKGIKDCSLQIQSGNLIADGLPHTWKQSLLIPRSLHVFDVQSLPFQVRFVNEDNRLRMYLTGPALLTGPVNYVFTKRM